MTWTVASNPPLETAVGSTPFEDWNVQQDQENIRSGAIDLQSELHRRHYSQMGPDYLRTARTFWRLQCLSKLEIFMGAPLSGKVLEIGAGTAWCSSLLSRMKSVRAVYALEYDPFCVHQLMPQLFKRLGADESKITRVLGSFNHMPKAKGLFDVIVSIGALHHSENLPRTLLECYRSLRPGGYLMATESCETNGLTRKEQAAKEEKIDPNSQSKYGKITRHKENSDHYFRLCEYEAAAFAAGFDVWPYVFDLAGEKQWQDVAFRERRTYDGFRKIVLYPYFAQDYGHPLFDRLCLILQKPSA